jgi:hypothetical protein
VWATLSLYVGIVFGADNRIREIKDEIQVGVRLRWKK